MASQSSVGWKGPYGPLKGHLQPKKTPGPYQRARSHGSTTRAASTGDQAVPPIAVPPPSGATTVTQLRPTPPPHLDPKPAPGGASPHGPCPFGSKGAQPRRLLGTRPRSRRLRASGNHPSERRSPRHGGRMLCPPWSHRAEPPPGTPRRLRDAEHPALPPGHGVGAVPRAAPSQRPGCRRRGTEHLGGSVCESSGGLEVAEFK